MALLLDSVLCFATCCNVYICIYILIDIYLYIYFCRYIGGSIATNSEVTGASIAATAASHGMEVAVEQGMASAFIG
jgi:hypothetical protein